MQNFDTRSRAIAYSLSALAGFVDAIGFIGSGGFFVSFMSGNSTRLGVGAATASSHALWLSLIGGSVLGALAFGWIGMTALWLAAGCAAVLAVFAARQAIRA